MTYLVYSRITTELDTIAAIINVPLVDSMTNSFTSVPALTKSLRLAVVFLSGVIASILAGVVYAQGVNVSMPTSLVELMPQACRTASQGAIPSLTDIELLQWHQWLISNEPSGISWPSVISTTPLALSTFKEILIKDGVKLGVWRAGLGSYSHPGGEDGEVFVTLKGAGALAVEDKKVPIHPGSISIVPPSTPSMLEITADAEKIVIICDR